jgi:hypothetical protein
VYDEDGRQAFQTNSGYYINLKPSIISGGGPNDKIHTVKSKLGLEEKNIQYLVADLQRRQGYCSKEVLKGKARCTEDFPVTEKQIEKLFVTFPARPQGHMQRSTL